MDTEFDINKVAAEFVADKIDSAWGLLSSQARGARDLLKSKFARTYRGYLERTLSRYSRGKSFFIRSEPTPLYSFFVPLDLESHTRKFAKACFVDLAELCPLSIITGSGGSGKTMLMRHMLIGAITSRLKTPIFLELRQLNSVDDSLPTALVQVLRQNGLNVDDDYFSLAVQAGHFAFLLDGFDELHHDRRDRLSAEIQDISAQHPGNIFILSSRPDQKLGGWGNFNELQVCPLDAERAADLVEKLPFEQAVKKKFSSDLRDDLFKRHESFLSNPLLLSIMLLTYQDAAHIPSKLSVFYSQAYESLFQKHDALKAGFQRQRLSRLDIQDFERVFAAFCIQSFERREFSFTRVRALELLESARKFVYLTYEANSVLDDCIQATCLLIEDGLEITFAHRSFQEYFVARFIATAPAEVKPQLVQHLSRSEAPDLVLALLHEIDPFLVEKHSLLPELERLRTLLSDEMQIDAKSLLRYLGTYWRGVGLDKDGSIYFAGRQGSSGFSQLFFAWSRFRQIEFANTDQTLLANAIKEESHERPHDGWSIDIESLTPDHKTVKLLLESRGIAGVRFLHELMRIKRQLEQQHAEMHASIADIWSGR
jgi:hypothetical protein